MSFARFAAITFAASVMWVSAASAAGPIRKFQVGFWSGGAYTDDRTGGFTHCSAGVAYDSGINLFVLLTAGNQWWLGFINPRWNFDPSSQLPVGLRLGRGPRLSITGTVPSREVVLVPLPDDLHLIDQLSHSSELNLVAERQSFFFRLNGTQAVTAELNNCVQRSVALESHTPAVPSKTVTSAAVTDAAAPAGMALAGSPPKATAATAAMPPRHAASAAAPASAAAASPTPGAAAPAPADPLTASAGTAPSMPAEPAPPALVPSATESATLDLPRPAAATAAPAFSPPAPTAQAISPAIPSDLEEARLAQDFFTSAQLPNAHLVVADKPAALASFTAVWRSDNAAGAVKIIAPGPDVSGAGISSNLIAVDPQMCKGNFASARSRTYVDNAVVFSVVLSCTESDEQRTAEYFITARRRGGFVVFAVVGSSAVDADGDPGSDQRRINLLTRAAVRAAEEG